MADIQVQDGKWKRGFAVFIAGQTISIFGSSLVQYAIMWHITLTTQSGVMMTISIVAGFIPVCHTCRFGYKRFVTGGQDRHGASTALRGRQGACLGNFMPAIITVIGNICHRGLLTLV